MAHHSPRPSLDGSHNHASTPFFHTLTQRLRKSSNASSYASDPSSPLSPTDPTSRTEATRAARRMVLSMVRDDWEWPPDPSPTPTANNNNNGGGRSPIPHREPLTYRLREEAQSDLEIEDYASKRRAAKSDPYKFESPEAVGTVIAERRRKRRKMQEEEMSWNEGLKTWHERRDAWTGALQQKPNSNKPTERRPSSTTKRPSYKSRLSQVFTGHKGDQAQPNSTDGGSTSWPVSPASPTPECSSVDSVEEPTSATRTTTNTTAEPLSPSSTSQPPSSPSSSTSTEPGPWIPIYPPILPQDNIIRERIKPSAYPTIYSKIVVQGLTPNVPIPLCHMIPALVEGWKSEGNWPPQPSATLAQDAKKGRKSSAFAKWRRENSTEDHQHNNNSPDSPSHHHHHHFFHTGSSPVGGGGGGTGAVAAAVVSGGPKDLANAQHEDGGGRGHRVRRSIGMMRRMGSLLAGSMSSDGLDELGIEFREKDEEEMGRNVALNKGLVH
ncbi:uncharacterized protein Z520_07862 [Fonsecaea multimorphosa CBS 102226]|uniref:Gag1-like clamp domain-containing protein n=1 Tax=Fonsecaea multimorphosa CBS 102226 TaxID=1442371 RepID=A0A0D2IHS8_9EURO|nr:uncharacterized protein Z520_07862 [Fonsecaea multimorphosa CBS 102226]KIX96596.1 hypothetical protein Z520_07862 [Fonsecaea multimorphosa CBS 102226]OAL22108.1 hypothetical protein AYO22_07468 [Fonsecaea multimorphosa]